MSRDREPAEITLTDEALAEAVAARAAVRRARAREYRIKTRGACLLCRDDEPSASYAGRFSCRACGRTW